MMEQVLFKIIFKKFIKKKFQYFQFSKEILKVKKLILLKII